MLTILKQSESVAALRTVGVLLTNTNDTPYTGAQPSAGDIKLKKAGVAVAETDHLGDWNHINNGYWEYTFTAGEINTNGKISMRIAKAGLYGDIFEWQVVPWDVNSSTNLGLSYVDATMSSRLPTAAYQTISQMLAEADTIDTGVNLKSLMVVIAAVLAGKTTGAGSGVEAFRSMLTDNRVVLTSTVDSNGNRTSITLNLPV